MAPSKASAIRKIVNNVNEETRQRKAYMNSQGYYSAADVRAMRRADTVPKRDASSSNNASSADKMRSTFSSSSVKDVCISTFTNKGTRNTTKSRITKSTTTKKTSSIGGDIIKRVEQFETKAARQADRLSATDAEEDVVPSIERHDSAMDDSNVTFNRRASSTSTLSPAPTDSPSTLSPAPTPARFRSPAPSLAATPVPTHSTNSASNTISPAPAAPTAKMVDVSPATSTTIGSANRPVRSSRAGAIANMTRNPKPPSPDWVTDAAEDPFGLFDDEESDDDEWSKGVHRAG